MVSRAVTRKISVLHIVLSTATGGMENVIYNLVSAHDPERLKIQVACLEAVGPLSEKFKQHGVSTDLLPRMTPGLSMIFPASLIGYIRKSGCDVVHTHSGCWSKVATACFWVPTVKLVYTDHGRFFPDLKQRIVLDRIAVKTTDRVVAVGEPLREYLVNTVRLPARKVITILNGIDTKRFAPLPEMRTTVRAELGFAHTDVVIAIVARLAPVKNHRLLIETLADLTKQLPQTRLLIIGDGPLRADLEKQVHALSLTGRVTFTGDRTDVERLLTGADISTLSSLSEGISLTLLEAMSTGLPVVATRVGGNPTIITEGHDGFIVGLDKSQYAEALRKLIESESLRRTLGENARKTVERKWSVSQMAARYQELYAELVA
jgi:glycosyltransferase involved in cell wall biosynthesis